MPTPVIHGFRSRGIAALPGYFLTDTTFAGFKTITGSRHNDQDSTALAGGWGYDSTAAQNNEWTHDRWFDSGTYKVAGIYRKASITGIDSIQFGGVEQAAIDTYAAATSSNNYAEVTGIAVTAGLKVVGHKGATKNASSTGYAIVAQTAAWVRTGA